MLVGGPEILNLDGQTPGPHVWQNPPEEYRAEGWQVPKEPYKRALRNSKETCKRAL